MPARPAIALAIALAASLLGACSRGGGREARARLEARDRGAVPAAFDWSSPASSLAMSGDEAARRLGSFDFHATVTWTVARGASPASTTGAAAAPGAQPEPLRARALERHSVRQLASGDFHVLAEIDPGTWSGAETGKEVLFVGGRTFARGRYAPFRERPTDRGRDARRFRDESFRLGGDLAALLGPALGLQERSQAVVLGRTARRFALFLARGGAAPPPGPAAQQPAGGADEDTRRRQEFVEGRVPLSLDGELVLDGETGVPLGLRVRAVFGEKGDSRLRAEVDAEARISALGGAVASVGPPRGALADERKPRGVARALEQAGLRRRGEAAEAEPEDEPAEGE